MEYKKNTKDIYCTFLKDVCVLVWKSIYEVLLQTFNTMLHKLYAACPCIIINIMICRQYL